MDTETLVSAITALDFEALAASLTFEIALVSVVALIISAFFSLRLFNIYISALGAFSFGYVGYIITAELIENGTIPMIEGINLYVAVGFAAAIVGFILAAFLHKVVLFVVGGLGGYLLGEMILVPIISGFIPLEGIASLIASIVIGVIVGALVCALFKPIYIFVTSIGGMALVGGIVTLLLLPFDLTTMIIGLVVGAVVGIIPMIYQFRLNAKEA